MAEEYGKISKSRLIAFADQARRLGKISGELTPGQIEDVLRGVTTGGGLASNEKKYQFADIESGVDASKIILETAISAVLQEV